MCSTKKKVITHYKPLGGFADGNKLEEILQVNLEVMTQFFIILIGKTSFCSRVVRCFQRATVNLGRGKCELQLNSGVTF